MPRCWPKESKRRSHGRAFTLDGTYIHLQPDDSARAMEGGDRFWAGIETRRDLDEGRLMERLARAGDWDHWERHPARRGNPDPAVGRDGAGAGHCPTASSGLC